MAENHTDEKPPEALDRDFRRLALRKGADLRVVVLVLAISGMYCTLAPQVSGQQSAEKDSCDRYLSAAKPKFEIVRKEKTTLRPGLQLFVSIPLSEANRSGLLTVGCQIGRDYAREPSLFVWILSNKRAAQRYNPQGEGNDRATASSFVALYGFDRNNGGSEQSLEWKPSPESPQHLIHIALGPPPRVP
jgi:hypothetical protein